MNKSNFTLKAIIISFAFWLVDSIIHKFISSEENFVFIPSDANEFGMRAIIIILLICFGIYADKQAMSILEKEKEKRIIFETTVSATNHIVNNLLNQMQYFKLVADEQNAFNDEDRKLYEIMINEGKELVKKLGSVEELSEDNITFSVHHKNYK